MYVYCVEMYIYCIYSTYIYIYIYIYTHTHTHTHTQQVCMSTSGIDIHYIEWGCRSRNPQEVHFVNGNFVLDLHDIFQERNPGTKWDLSILDLCRDMGIGEIKT